jgi:omega-6 fatty acid desaturase (delta-12 desaturase)
VSTACVTACLPSQSLELTDPPLADFQPSSIIFKPEHWSQIIMSDVGLLIVLSAVGYWASQRGFKEVLVLYILPYLQVNHWLVAITFAQHTDPLLRE